MKLNPKEILRPALSLFVICLAVTALLVATDLLTKEQIAHQEYLAEMNARIAVCPQGESFEAGDAEASYYVASDSKGIVGYIFTTEASGYGGTIRVMTGINAEGEITGISFLSIDETPGLGMNAKKESFTAQYKQDVSEKGITLVKGTPGENEISAMTGATITSRAVTDAVNQAVTKFQQIQKMKEGA